MANLNANEAVFKLLTDQSLESYEQKEVRDKIDIQGNQPVYPTLLINGDGTMEGYMLDQIPDEWRDASTWNGDPLNEKSGLRIGDGVTSIGSYAFNYWNSNDQPLVIPDSTTGIGNFSFNYWISNNKPLVIPDSITSIGSYAFYNWMSNTQPLVIPDSVTNIGSSAFYFWSSNNYPLVIPDSVTGIGSRAFSFWTSNNQPIYIACNNSALAVLGETFISKGSTPAIYVLSGKGFTLGVQNFQGLANVDIQLWTSYPNLMP